jgi:uncharacterized membrane protein
MNSLIVIRVIALVCVGLVAGIYFGDRAGGVYARTKLRASDFIQFQQIVHVHFVKILPFLVIGSAFASLAWLFLMTPQWRGAQFWLVGTSTCGIFLAAILTRVVNVPLNKQLMTWNVDNPPVNLKEMWAPWETIHTIRTFAMMGAFVLETVALCL